MSAVASPPARARPSNSLCEARGADVRGRVFQVDAAPLAARVPRDPGRPARHLDLPTAWPVLTERGLGLRDERHLRARLPGGRQARARRLADPDRCSSRVFAIPIGVAAAIYLQEYARDTRLNRSLITNIRNLAGVPSIVYGILGLVVFVQALRGDHRAGDRGPQLHLRRSHARRSWCMPIIIIITMEALRAVPKSIREAAYGVGATRWEVVRSHVLPYAAPGVFTGAILSLARAFGETAPLLLVGAVTGYFSTPAAGLARDPCKARTPPCPPDLLVVPLPGSDWQANTAAAIIVLLVVHPGRERDRDRAEEPV